MPDSENYTEHQSFQERKDKLLPKSWEISFQAYINLGKHEAVEDLYPLAGCVPLYIAFAGASNMPYSLQATALIT